MERIKLVSLPMLIDMLSDYTAKYSEMHKEGGSKEDFDNCFQLIVLLTREIELRKKTALQETTIHTI